MNDYKKEFNEQINEFTSPTFQRNVGGKRKATITTSKSPSNKMDTLMNSFTKSFSSVASPVISNSNIQIGEPFSGSRAFEMLSHMEVIDTNTFEAQKLEDRRFNLQKVVKDPKRLQEINMQIANKLDEVHPKVITQNHKSHAFSLRPSISTLNDINNYHSNWNTMSELATQDKTQKDIHKHSNIEPSLKIKASITSGNSNESISTQISPEISDRTDISDKSEKLNKFYRIERTNKIERVDKIDKTDRADRRGSISPYRQSNINTERSHIRDGIQLSYLTPYQKQLLKKLEEKTHIKDNPVSIPQIHRKPKNHLIPYVRSHNTWNALNPKTNNEPILVTHS